MSKPENPKDRSTAADKKVGYKQPPARSRFKPGASGNPSGQRKRLKPRSMSRAVQDVFTREMTVHYGRQKRRVPSIVALIEKALVEAMKGDKQATRFCYRVAEEFGVFKLKDEVQIDLSGLTEEERAICERGRQILNNAGVLFRYENR